MTRKRSRYRPRLACAPMLVVNGLGATKIETAELMLPEAFTGGWATTEHFDSLVDMRNVLTIATAYKDDRSAATLVEAMRVPLANLRDRHAKTGRFGVTGDELQLLRTFVTYYRDFWLRQPAEFYVRCCDELQRAL